MWPSTVVGEVLCGRKVVSSRFLAHNTHASCESSPFVTLLGLAGLALLVPLLICRSRCLCGPTGTHRFVAHEHRRREPSVAGAAWLTLEIFCHLARYASERLRFHVYRFLIALSVRPTKCFEISDHLVPSSETHATISASSSTVQPPFFTSELLSFFHRSRHCFPVRPLTSSAISDQCPSPDLATATRLGAAHPSRPSTCTTGWRPRGFSCVMLEMMRLPPLLLLVLLLPPPPPMLLLLLLHVRPPRAAHRSAAARAPRAHARRRPGGWGRP